MTTVWAAQKGASASQVSNLITAWSAVYMVCALAIGRIVTKRNSAWLMIGACIATSVLSVAATAPAAQSLWAMYALTGLMGVTMAIFFTPFQVFMKLVGERKQRSITTSVGLYTFSWSCGYAIGPFLAGYLWERVGWNGCQLLNGAACVMVAVATYVIHLRIQRTHSPQARTDPAEAPDPPPDAYEDKPDLAWMSWVFGGVGCIAVAVVRGVFASTGRECHIPKFEQGVIFAVLSAVQATVGLSLSLGKRWMYRPLPILGFGLCGTIGMVLFSSLSTTAGFLVAAVLFGVYTGSFYFCFVFHSLVHPHRAARYISINEAVVGLTGIVGPFAGGLLAEKFSLSTPYAPPGCWC